MCLGVLDALQHAHEHHVVHRDLKPSNVLVSRDGVPKLLDFGIAKILEPGGPSASTFSALRPMTPDYASPEQVRGEQVTPATDVYASGLLLYRIFTGHHAYRFRSDTLAERARVICDVEPEPPGLQGPLDAIVLKALRKEPGQRYPTVAALADDLRRFLQDQPVTAGRDARRYRAARFLRRHRLRLGLAGLVVAAIGGTALVTRSLSPPLTPAPAPAQPTAPARPSVAVLGFRNLNARPADQWLATAAAEMLITELSGDGQLRVVTAERVERAARDPSSWLST